MARPTYGMPSLEPQAEGEAEAYAEAYAKAETDPEAGVDSETGEPPWRYQFEYLWVLAILTFGFGDVLTTGWAVQNGATEANPFLHDLVHGNFGLFIMLKGLLLGVAYIYSTIVLADEDIDARFMPFVFILAGLFLMASNIMVTLGLIGTISG